MNDVLLWSKEKWGETAGFRAAGHGTINYLSCLGPRRSGIFPAITPFRQHLCAGAETHHCATCLMCGKVLVQQVNLCVKLCWRQHVRQHKMILMNWIFFSFFFCDSNGQTFYQIKKMAFNRLSQNLSLTECFEMNWFKQLVFFFLYLVYEHTQQQILNPQTWTAGLTLWPCLPLPCFTKVFSYIGHNLKVRKKDTRCGFKRYLLIFKEFWGISCSRRRDGNLSPDFRWQISPWEKYQSLCQSDDFLQKSPLGVFFL